MSGPKDFLMVPTEMAEYPLPPVDAHDVLAVTREMRETLKHMVSALNEKDQTTHAALIQQIVVDLQKLEAFEGEFGILYW